MAFVFDGVDTYVASASLSPSSVYKGELPAGATVTSVTATGTYYNGPYDSNHPFSGTLTRSTGAKIPRSWDQSGTLLTINGQMTGSVKITYTVQSAPAAAPAKTPAAPTTIASPVTKIPVKAPTGGAVAVSNRLATTSAAPPTTILTSAQQQTQINATGCYDLNRGQQCQPGFTPDATFTRCCGPGYTEPTKPPPATVTVPTGATTTTIPYVPAQVTAPPATKTITPEMYARWFSKLGDKAPVTSTNVAPGGQTAMITDVRDLGIGGGPTVTIPTGTSTAMVPTSAAATISETVAAVATPEAVSTAIGETTAAVKGMSKNTLLLLGAAAFVLLFMRRR